MNPKFQYLNKDQKPSSIVVLFFDNVFTKILTALVQLECPFFKIMIFGILNFSHGDLFVI